MSEEKELLFEVRGVEIFRGSIYIAKHKEDLSAPSGFQETGTTKLPSDGVDDSFQCPWVQTSATTGVWDTGFHEYSPCYKQTPKEVVKLKVSNLVENLVKPYSLALGTEDILSHKNNEFWNNKMFKIFSDKVFNTEDPEDLLTLYFGLLSKELTPKGEEGNTQYSDSAFVLVDKTKDIKKTDERSSNLFEAIGVVEALIQTDKPLLFAILSYLNITISEEASNPSIRTIVKGFFEQETKGVANVDTFLRTFKESKKKEGRAKLEIFVQLKAALKRGNKVTKNPNGVLYYGDTEIGPDLKSASINIAKTKEFEEIKREILLSEELENEN